MRQSLRQHCAPARAIRPQLKGLQETCIIWKDVIFLFSAVCEASLDRIAQNMQQGVRPVFLLSLWGESHICYFRVAKVFKTSHAVRHFTYLLVMIPDLLLNLPVLALT